MSGVYIPPDHFPGVRKKVEVFLVLGEMKMVSLNTKKEVAVEAKTLNIHTKVGDSLSFTIKDQEGWHLFFQGDGDVPDFFPGDNYGDYVILEIDIDTGQILNWEKPDAVELQNLINGDDE
jgi:hypothetical protein